MLNFTEQTGSGAVTVVWSFLTKIAKITNHNKLGTYYLLHHYTSQLRKVIFEFSGAEIDVKGVKNKNKNNWFYDS